VRLHNKKFPPGYIDEVFAIWYDAGKPVTPQLYSVIPEYTLLRDKPNMDTLREWIRSPEWVKRTEKLDLEVRANFDKKQILSKVEMLERHANVGREMQVISLEWLRDNKDDLSPGTAVRMLVDGIDIERATAGIPDALRKMQDMNDEDLTDEITKLLADTPVDANN